MFSKFFKKKKEEPPVRTPLENIDCYHMNNAPYKERKDDIYEYAKIYPYNNISCDSDIFLDFSYALTCKLAENNNLCYYVEYNENYDTIAELREVIADIEKNFENGDSYSIIYGEKRPILCVRQSKPSVETMRKAGKAGLDFTEGVLAYIYRDVPQREGTLDIINGVGRLSVEKHCMIRIAAFDYDNEMQIKYDKSLISFDEIRKAAEETAHKYGAKVEVNL